MFFVKPLCFAVFLETVTQSTQRTMKDTTKYIRWILKQILSNV